MNSFQKRNLQDWKNLANHLMMEYRKADAMVTLLTKSYGAGVKK